jgi:hypothetical protein
VKSLNLPISQFYAGTVDFSNPIRYYGGMQDNGTARTLTGVANSWGEIIGGDGMYVLVDPTNSSRVYGEIQWAGFPYGTGPYFSTNSGNSFASSTSGLNLSDRINWTPPLAIDPNNPLTIYLGSYRVYKTTNGMQSWTAISSDLTRGNGGRVGTISTIAVAKSNSTVL